MKINSQKLFSLYMRDVNAISETCDWKTQFGPEEIVGMICNILENEYFAPIKELVKTRAKLLPEWSQETSDFVDELYSRLEWAETEVEVFNARLNKQWSAGSNLYSQKEVDALVEAEYSIGFDVGYEKARQEEKDLTEAYNQGYEDGKNNYYGENRECRPNTGNN